MRFAITSRPAARSAAAPLCRALCLLLLLVSVQVSAAGRSVSFRTDDGVTLAGTWYEPSARQAPAVVLVHMLGRTRHDWDALATFLSSQGFGVLAFDLRGHGESQGSRPADDQYSEFVKDLAAARHYAVTRPDVLPARLAFVGASIGANLAVLQAAQAPGVAGIALLSPSTDYRGLRIEAAFRKYGGRTLLVASDDDPYSLRSTRELIKAAGGPNALRETLTVTAAGHGTTMLTRAPDLPRALADWLRRTLQ